MSYNNQYSAAMDHAHLDNLNAYLRSEDLNTPPPVLQRQANFYPQQQTIDATVVNEFFPDQATYAYHQSVQAAQGVPDSSSQQQMPYDGQQQQQPQVPPPPTKQRRMEAQQSSQERMSSSQEMSYRSSRQAGYDPRDVAVPLGINGPGCFPPKSVSGAAAKRPKPEPVVDLEPEPTETRASDDVSVSHVYDQPDAFGLGNFGGRLFFNNHTGKMFCFVFDRYSYKQDRDGKLVMREGKPVFAKGNLNLRLERRDIIQLIALLQTTLDFDQQSELYGPHAAKKLLQSRANEQFKLLNGQDQGGH